MKVFTIAIVLSGLTVTSLTAQKLETQGADTKTVTRVETAMDHLTVIELADPVAMVAVGNQGAFDIERRENKVFVKPVEEGARTNLFIWTAAGRLAYELVPARSVDEMHFAVDQLPAPVVAEAEPESESDVARENSSLPVEMLTDAAPVMLSGERETRGRVEIALRDLYREGNRLYVRYAVTNRSGRTYDAAQPSVSLLTGLRSPQSLVPLAGRQLGERLLRSLAAKTAFRLNVADAGSPARVAPGGQAVSWLAVEEPEGVADSLHALRFEFPADSNGSVDAVLVLRAGQPRQEVANARPAAE